MPPIDPQNASRRRHPSASRTIRAPGDEHIPDWRRRILTRLESRGGYPRWVLIAGLAGMFASSFSITILTVSLASIAKEFGESETTIAWVLSAPMLLSAVSFPLVGKLGDLYGHRRIFLLGILGTTTVAILTVFSWDALSLIGFRTAAAVLGGATQPTAMALIFTVYPAEERVRAMGWWSMTTAAAPSLGLIAGGPLIDLFGWRIVFFFEAGLGALGLCLAYVVLRETSRKDVRFDVWGAFFLAIGVGGFMWALSSVTNENAAGWWIPTSLAVGAAGVIAFILVERRVADPLLPLAFFASRNFSATLVTNGLVQAAYMGAFFLIPLALGRESGLGYSATIVAYIMLTRTASLTIFSPLGGTLGKRFGERWIAVAGCALMSVSLSVMAWGAYHGEVLAIVFGLIGQGSSFGLSTPSITSAITRSVDDSNLGIASSTNRLFGQTGSAFGIAVMSLVYGGINDPTAFGLAFIAATILSILAVAAAVFMGPERRGALSTAETHA